MKGTNMSSDPVKNKEYIAKLSEIIEEGDNDAAVELTSGMIKAGMTPMDIFSDIIHPILSDMGDAFARLEVFLPELMKAAMVVKSIQSEVLDPEIRKNGDNSFSAGKVVIGTCQGDIHDIGKSMVAMLLQVNGFSVTDLGVNVTPKDFLDTAKRENADIIAMSSLLTTSLPFIKDVISRMEAFGLRDKFKVVVGGAAVNPEWASSAGLDGFGRDAVEAVEICKNLCAKLSRKD